MNQKLIQSIYTRGPILGVFFVSTSRTRVSPAIERWKVLGGVARWVSLFFSPPVSRLWDGWAWFDQFQVQWEVEVVVFSAKSPGLSHLPPGPKAVVWRSTRAGRWFVRFFFLRAALNRSSLDMWAHLKTLGKWKDAQSRPQQIRFKTPHRNMLHSEVRCTVLVHGRPWIARRLSKTKHHSRPVMT